MNTKSQTGTEGIAHQARRAVLLSSYGTGADKGKNMGVPGYSHDIVMQLYAPILEKWGTVVPVAQPEENLEQAISQVRAEGYEPVHLSVIPCQDAYLSPNCANVLMPAWEFPDIPNEAFDSKPSNDWTSVAKQCDGLIVSGPFTSNAFRKAGVEVPIHHVQVPTHPSWFDVNSWDPHQQESVECSGYSFAQATQAAKHEKPALHLSTVRKKKSLLKKVGQPIERSIKKAFCAAVSNKFQQGASEYLRSFKKKYALPDNFDFESLDLSGVVYTSIFNPKDGRKNWTDLVTSFLAAVGDREDATLVIKLITRDRIAVARFLRFYLGRQIDHKCRIVVTNSYLSDEEMVQLANASTYYIQTTRAEGNCLPLMNFLAAGRPGVSPCHSAISDYFDGQVGFVAESHAEPAAWPHDPEHRMRSTWGRLVWTSMVEQIRESYRVAKEEPEAYQTLATNARQRLEAWASTENVENRLVAVLEQVFRDRVHGSRTQMVSPPFHGTSSELKAA